jgi:pyrimidine-nucleoside phosphorylase
MNIVQIIDKKRRGEAHTQDEIDFLIEGSMTGLVADYQLAAWLMAAHLQGISLQETTWLTESYVKSGRTLDLSEVNGIVVDKHSTGGVGDKTTLIVVPLLAAAGVKVAKLSGRGLGFTGGTIDKLEAIPGFQTHLSSDAFLCQLLKVGAVISSQTEDLAPADGITYALRDVTATVADPNLIAASVVSKKIAAGASIIVLDIKYGRGAFMGSPEEALQLADICRQVGQALGREMVTVISSMDQPLGLAIGHSLEVVEAMETLKGKGPKDLEQLCLHLAGQALVKAGLHHTQNEAEKALKQLLDDGKAFETFRQMVKAQGGDIESLDDPSMFPQPDRVTYLPAPSTGYVCGLDTLKVAEAVKHLGGGRLTKEASLDLGVGVVLHKKIGDAVEEGETLVELHASSEPEEYKQAVTALHSAFRISPQPVFELPALIYNAPAHQVPV